MDILSALASDHPRLVGLFTLATAALVVETFVPKPNSTIPSGRPLPFIGHTWLILSHAWRGKAHELLDRGRKELGTISRSELVGNIHTVTVAEPEAIKKVFCSDDFVRSNFVLPMTVGIFRFALFVMPTDTVWKKHRRFLVRSLGVSHLRQALDATNAVMDKLTVIWAKGLESHGSSYESDMFHVASSITVDVIGQVAFSVDYRSVENHEKPESSQMMRAYQRAFDVISTRSFLPEPFWYFVGVGTSKVKGELATLRKTIQSTINSKRQSRPTAPTTSQTSEKEAESPTFEPDRAFSNKVLDRLDVLDHILEAPDWTDEEITDEVIALFLAGGETSANTITFCVLLLDQHPEVRDKMIAEIDSVLLNCGHDLTLRSLADLKYTESVIKETLRLYPVVGVPVARQAIRDTELMGHRIRKGTFAFTDLRGLHRNEKYWKFAEVFSPSRWIDFTPAPGTYLPFGDGPHTCIGKNMAMVELKVVLTRIYSKFIPSVVPNQDLEPVSSVTLGLKKGLRVNLQPRE
ncbi:hypothetical protein HDU97_007304 [Phlyctochytrium planicorne]|nr:hypothetical protein HDU97_007304 [Phlyctochytrium planicorne]